MIQETIVTTVSAAGLAHIAPMGVHVRADSLLILPFRPSTTLDNLLATGHAVLNHTDDVRVFAGCLTGRRDWPLLPAERISGLRLAQTLTHTELALERFENDPVRPRCHCRVLHQVTHGPFAGFNRAQFAVLEAAILASRLDRLSRTKIDAELEYLRIGLEKCAGPREREAWAWLMERIDGHYAAATGEAPA